jgi:2-keto-4-pentenoate hydratase
VRVQIALDDLADQLFLAERERTPVEPLTQTAPHLSADDAYKIQLINAKRRLAAGARVAGHKIGLTAKAMQQLMGIEEPDYGHLFDDMFLLESTSIAMDRFISPRIEIETAFILGRKLDGHRVTVADVIRATDWVVPAFEIIDSRIREWRITGPRPPWCWEGVQGGWRTWTSATLRLSCSLMASSLGPATRATFWAIQFPR